MEFLFKHVRTNQYLQTITYLKKYHKRLFFFILANRVSTMHDFGYVALNLKYVYPEDSGTYTCRAINELGEAVTSATLNVQCKCFDKYYFF